MIQARRCLLTGLVFWQSFRSFLPARFRSFLPALCPCPGQGPAAPCRVRRPLSCTVSHLSGSDRCETNQTRPGGALSGGRCCAGAEKVSPATVKAHLYGTPERSFTLRKRSFQAFEAHLYGTPERSFTLWKRSLQVFVGEPGHRVSTPVRDT